MAIDKERQTAQENLQRLANALNAAIEGIARMGLAGIHYGCTHDVQCQALLGKIQNILRGTTNERIERPRPRLV